MELWAVGAFEELSVFTYNQAMYRKQIATGSQYQARPRLAVVIALLSAFWGSSASAATVYKTVDEMGVVSYSDTPPPAEVPVETMVIDVQTPDLSETSQEQLEAMRETTDRMVADRQQREKHRADMRQQQLASQPQPQVIEYTTPATYNRTYNRTYSGNYPVYYPYPVHRPGHKPRPGHPIVRPPLRPHKPVQLPAGVISPGHDYPASLVRRGYSPQVRAAFEK